MKRTRKRKRKQKRKRKRQKEQDKEKEKVAFVKGGFSSWLPNPLGKSVLYLQI
jgi:hypothetical protein